VRDDDELRPIGIAAEELDETRDVGIVERGLDLVEEVERARPREEEREEERDRTERLLAAGEQHQARDPLPRRPELDLDARLALAVLLVGLDEAQAALAAREERRRDLLEVRRDRGERLVEAAVDRFRQLVAEGGELGERRLEVDALLGELVEPHLLVLVLLARQWVDLPERLAPRVEARDPHRELVAVDLLGVDAGRVLGDVPARGDRLIQASLRLDCLSLEPRQLDLDGGRALGDLVGRLPELDLARTEAAQLRSELGGPGGASVDTGPDGRLEPRCAGRGAHERVAQGGCHRQKALEEVGVDGRAARRALDERGLGRAGVVAGPLRARRCVLEGRERLGRLRGELAPRAVARRPQADGHAPEPRDDDVRRCGGPRTLGRLAPRLELERGQASQLLGELARAPLAC
jgi:hypothetical protein